MSCLPQPMSGSHGPVAGAKRLYYLVMAYRTLTPLVSWDGLHLVLDLKLVERHLQEWLRGRQAIRHLWLEGAGDAVRLWMSLRYQGMTMRVGVELAEIRLKRRHLGLRMRKVRVLGGIPLARVVVEQIIAWLDPDLITVSGHGILVVDLGRWLPPELKLEVLTVQASERALHIWFGPGSLDDLPGLRRPALAASALAGQQPGSPGPGSR